MVNNKLPITASRILTELGPATTIFFPSGLKDTSSLSSLRVNNIFPVCTSHTLTVYSGIVLPFTDIVAISFSSGLSEMASRLRSCPLRVAMNAPERSFHTLMLLSLSHVTIICPHATAELICADLQTGLAVNLPVCASHILMHSSTPDVVIRLLSPEEKNVENIIFVCPAKSAITLPFDTSQICAELPEIVATSRPSGLKEDSVACPFKFEIKLPVLKSHTFVIPVFDEAMIVFLAGLKAADVISFGYSSTLAIRAPVEASQILTFPSPEAVMTLWLSPLKDMELNCSPLPFFVLSSAINRPV